MTDVRGEEGRKRGVKEASEGGRGEEGQKEGHEGGREGGRDRVRGEEKKDDDLHCNIH